MDLSQHKSKDDDQKHGHRLHGKEAEDTGGKKQEHGKEMREHHSSQIHAHDHGNKHSHGHGHKVEHVGGSEHELVEYLDTGGMTAGAFLEARYRAATGRPYECDKVERLISSEQIAKQQSEEEAAGREENKGVVYKF